MLNSAAPLGIARYSTSPFNCSVNSGLRMVIFGSYGIGTNYTASANVGQKEANANMVKRPGYT
jgi:hypothetical protein